MRLGERDVAGSPLVDGPCRRSLVGRRDATARPPCPRCLVARVRYVRKPREDRRQCGVSLCGAGPCATAGANPGRRRPLAGRAAMARRPCHRGSPPRLSAEARRVRRRRRCLAGRSPALRWFRGGQGRRPGGTGHGRPVQTWRASARADGPSQASRPPVARPRAAQRRPKDGRMTAQRPRATRRRPAGWSNCRRSAAPADEPGSPVEVEGVLALVSVRGHGAAGGL